MTQDNDVITRGLDRDQRRDSGIGDPILDQHRGRKDARRRHRYRYQRRRKRAEDENSDVASVVKHRPSSAVERRRFYTARVAERHIEPFQRVIGLSVLA